MNKITFKFIIFIRIACDIQISSPLLATRFTVASKGYENISIAKVLKANAMSTELNHGIVAELSCVVKS